MTDDDNLGIAIGAIAWEHAKQHGFVEVVHQGESDAAAVNLDVAIDLARTAIAAGQRIDSEVQTTAMGMLIGLILENVPAATFDEATVAATVILNNMLPPP